MENMTAIEKFLFQDSHFFTEEFAEFLQKSYFLMPTWKWIFFFSVITIGFVALPVFRATIVFFKNRSPIVNRFPHSFWAYALKSQAYKSAAWILTILMWGALFNLVTFPTKLDTYIGHILKGLIAFFIIRMIYNLIDATGNVLMNYSAKTGSQFDNQLVPFAEKTAKGVIVVLGFLIVLQSFGLNVVSLLAGLGLGGLALALAAQDTAANLFGSVTILLDRPFSVGDLIKVKDLEGTVEEIGLRSTRIRTLYNSVITVPNGTMAKEYIDNMGVRPARRIRLFLGLTYDTTPEKMEAFCKTVENYLKSYDEVIGDSITVAFTRYSDSSLDVLVNFHLRVVTAPEEIKHQQIIYLEFLKIAKSLNVDFAFPSRTLYHVTANSTTETKDMVTNGP